MTEGRSTSPSSPIDQPTDVVVGRSPDRRIVIQSMGNALIEANYVAFAPAAAREIARQILALCDAIEGEER